MCSTPKTSMGGRQRVPRYESYRSDMGVMQQLSDRFDAIEGEKARRKRAAARQGKQPSATRSGPNNGVHSKPRTWFQRLLLYIRHSLPERGHNVTR